MRVPASVSGGTCETSWASTIMQLPQHPAPQHNPLQSVSSVEDAGLKAASLASAGPATA